MPTTTWGHNPTITPHGYGFTVPVAVTHIPADPEDPTPSERWEGIGVEVRSLTSVDIEAGIEADPDAGPEHLTEALTRALDQSAPGVQPQIDALIDIMLEV